MPFASFLGYRPHSSGSPTTAKVFMQTLIHRDSKPWQLQVWVSFLIAVFLCAVGLSWLPGKDLDRAFMVMGYFFCLSAAFVLAKYVRDQEQSKAGGKLADTPMFKLVVWGGFFLAMSLTGWAILRPTYGSVGTFSLA